MSTVDHICLDERLLASLSEVGAFEAPVVGGEPIGDHCGAWVELDLRFLS